MHEQLQQRNTINHRRNRQLRAHSPEAFLEYAVELINLSEVSNADCIIVAVAHDEFRKLKLEDVKSMYRKSADEEKVLIDVKGLYQVSDLEKNGMRYWRL